VSSLKDKAIVKDIGIFKIFPGMEYALSEEVSYGCGYNQNASI